MHASVLALAATLLAAPSGTGPALLRGDPGGAAAVLTVQFGDSPQEQRRKAIEQRRREIDRLRHAAEREREERRRQRLEAMRGSQEAGGAAWKADGQVQGSVAGGTGAYHAESFAGGGEGAPRDSFGRRHLAYQLAADPDGDRRARRLATAYAPARSALTRHLLSRGRRGDTQAAQLAREYNQRSWERQETKRAEQAPTGELGPLGKLRWGDLVRRDNEYSIFQTNDLHRLVANRDDTDRFRWNALSLQEYTFDNGWTESVASRRDGSTVRTLRDAEDVPIRRTRTDANGDEVTLFNNLPSWWQEKSRIDVNIGAEGFDTGIGGQVIDGAVSSLDELYRAATAEPLGNPRRSFTLNQLLVNEGLRGLMPGIDVDTINFETNSAVVSEDEMAVLELIGAAISAAVAANPREVFLIEGHTDAKGDDLDNMELSDRRAEAVAMLLTEAFNIPPENFVTHGYGEEFLKVETQDEERRNRRVTIRRITPLLTEGTELSPMATAPDS
ncbi:hypothetical protein DLJ53_05980 [Acuticoccus sediminis]|uniref:OmpA-like domain-containing protein n=1 Tax=Acuticoccus sediminis TaxID=2184697 RepID=A0A8B2P616_9HYPH|nr:OmpA family protein [Acuticoccus sediminis]RAI04009.1 hypothetical protein DLJ53_05980 [Acuticoccus sediminis]